VSVNLINRREVLPGLSKGSESGPKAVFLRIESSFDNAFLVYGLIRIIAQKTLPPAYLRCPWKILREILLSDSTREPRHLIEKFKRDQGQVGLASPNIGVQAAHVASSEKILDDRDTKRMVHDLQVQYC